jgi:hypothetical protein
MDAEEVFVNCNNFNPITKVKKVIFKVFKERKKSK